MKRRSLWATGVAIALTITLVIQFTVTSRCSFGGVLPVDTLPNETTGVVGSDESGPGSRVPQAPSSSANKIHEEGGAKPGIVKPDSGGPATEQGEEAGIHDTQHTDRSLEELRLLDVDELRAAVSEMRTAFYDEIERVHQSNYDNGLVEFLGSADPVVRDTTDVMPGFRTTPTGEYMRSEITREEYPEFFERRDLVDAAEVLLNLRIAEERLGSTGGG